MDAVVEAVLRLGVWIRLRPKVAAVVYAVSDAFCMKGLLSVPRKAHRRVV